MMKDDLHPGEAGYRIWDDAMEPKLRGIARGEIIPGGQVERQPLFGVGSNHRVDGGSHS